MPFQGYLVGFCTWHVMTLSLWFLIPIKWRQSEELRKRLKYVIWLLLVISIAEFGYKIIRKIFLVIPDYIQWSLFVVLLALRELHSKLLSCLGKKVVGFAPKVGPGLPLFARVFTKNVVKCCPKAGPRTVAP